MGEAEPGWPNSSRALVTRPRFLLRCIMQHRHLITGTFTLAAIDDAIARGRRADWAALRRALLADRAVREKVLRVCAPRVADPYAQRYHFWKYYAEQNAPA